MPKFTLSFFSGICGITIVILSTIPIKIPLEEPLILEVDKLGHSFAYFCFSISLFLAFIVDWKLKSPKKWTILVSFGLGLLLEFTQGALLSYRSFELYDILANTIGIVLFIFSSKTIKKLLSNAVFL